MSPRDRPDEYEAKYMEGGRSLVRDRMPMPRWFHALMAAATLVSIGSAVTTGTFVGLITLPVLLLTWLLLSFLRLTVTEETVHVQFGLWGPRIPIEEIVTCTAGYYDPLKFGGWGIRLAMDGTWAYSVPGGSRRGVLIEYRGAAGRTRKVFVSTDRADDVVAAVAQIQGARGARVRVDGAGVARSEASEVERAVEAGDARREGRE